jgi:hypothetical protein
MEELQNLFFGKRVVYRLLRTANLQTSTANVQHQNRRQKAESLITHPSELAVIGCTITHFFFPLPRTNAS